MSYDRTENDKMSTDPLNRLFLTRHDIMAEYFKKQIHVIMSN